LPKFYLKKSYLTGFLIIKPRHPDGLKSPRSGWRNPAVGALFTTAKISGCANVSSNSSRVEKVYGWDGGHPKFDSLKLVNYTRIENAHKVRKHTSAFQRVTVIFKTTGGTE